MLKHLAAALLVCAVSAPAAASPVDHELTGVALDAASQKVKTLLDLVPERQDEAEEGATPVIKTRLATVYERLTLAKARYEAFAQAHEAGNQPVANVQFGAMCLAVSSSRVALASAYAELLNPPLDPVYAPRRSLFDQANAAIDFAKAWSRCP